MAINRKFIDQFIKVSSKAALAASYLIGKKNKIAADKASDLILLAMVDCSYA